MKKFVPSVFLLLLSLCCMAQSGQIPIAIPLSGFWNGFYGKVDSSEVSLVIYLFDNGDVKGDFWYTKDLIKKNVSGRIINNHLTLTEYTNHKLTGYFDGVIKDGEYMTISGMWQDSGRTQLKPFSLTHGSIYGGTFDHRYADCIPYGSEEEVDYFARRLKDAILTGDKQWIADHLFYPLGTAGHNQVDYKIKNREDFLRNFDNIITKKYKERVKTWPPFDLGCRYDGLSFGNIWIYNCEGSNEKNYSYCIAKIF